MNSNSTPQSTNYFQDLTIVNIKSSVKLKNVGKSTLDFLANSDEEWLRQREILTFQKKLNFYVVRCPSSLTFTLFTATVESSPQYCHANITGHSTTTDLDRHKLRLLRFLTEATLEQARARGNPPPLAPELVPDSGVIDCMTSRLRLKKELNLMLAAHNLSTTKNEISVSFNPTTFSGLVLRHNQLRTCVLHRRVALFFGQKSTSEIYNFLDLLLSWRLI